MPAAPEKLQQEELQQRALEARRSADVNLEVVAKLVERRGLIEADWNETQSRLEDTRGDEAAFRSQITSIQTTAETGVSALSKQQLEEVRSLQNPSPILHRALGLLYCVLFPEKGLQFKTPQDVPWKQKLAPMLRRDDLIRKLLDFPPPQTAHPLLAYPALVQFIEDHTFEQEVAPETKQDGCNHAESQGRKASKSRKPSGSSRAPQLLQTRSRSSFSEVLLPPSPSSGGSIVNRNGLIGEMGGLQRNLSCSSMSSSLLCSDGRLTCEAVDYASTAVGALFRWVLSQLKYVRAIKTAEVDRLEGQASILHAKSNGLIEQLANLTHVLEGVQAGITESTNKAEAASVLADELERKSSVYLTEAASMAEETQRQEESVAAEEAVRDEESDGSQQELLNPGTEPPSNSQEPALAQILERGDVALSSVDVEVRERITFAHGSVEMSSFATRAVQGVLSVMNGNADIMLCVEGHCRPDEAASLGTRRANAVLEELVAQGVPRHRLREAGFGSAFPEGAQGSDARVEFSVIQEISIKGTVQFGPCSDRLASSSGPLLEKIVALLIARSCLRVRIEGHTDSSPNWGCSNQELSEGRAQNVVQYMSDCGISSGRLVAVGFGEKLPRVSNGAQGGKAQNRRVEFHILQRETIQGLREMFGQGRRDNIDAHAVHQLQRTANGETVGLSLPIRVAAADLLTRLLADWEVQRLLYIAARKEEHHLCFLSRLPDDCVRRILRFYFLLGCSALSESR